MSKRLSTQAIRKRFGVNKLIIIVLITSFGYSWSMENEQKGAGSGKPAYKSLKTEVSINNAESSGEEDTSELDDLSDKGKGKKNSRNNNNNNNGNKHKRAGSDAVITIHLENGDFSIEQNKINTEKQGNLKLKAAGAAWKAYCTPKAFRDASCGTLAIFMVFFLYKMALAAESIANATISD